MERITESENVVQSKTSQKVKQRGPESVLQRHLWRHSGKRSINATLPFTACLHIMKEVLIGSSTDPNMETWNLESISYCDRLRCRYLKNRKRTYVLESSLKIKVSVAVEGGEIGDNFNAVSRKLKPLEKQKLTQYSCLLC